MPQRKPLIARNSRHVDGIKEMIDFVRNCQGPIIRENTNGELRIKQHSRLPGIGQPGSSIDDHLTAVGSSIDTDTDPAYESDNELDVEFASRLRTPSPPIRTCSRLSSKSSHSLGLSKSLDAGVLSKTMRPARVNRQLSLKDQELYASQRPVVRALPPVYLASQPDRPTAPVPGLDLSGLEPESDDSETRHTIRRGSFSHPQDSPSPTDSLAEDGKPIDYIES